DNNAAASGLAVLGSGHGADWAGHSRAQRAPGRAAAARYRGADGRQPTPVSMRHRPRAGGADRRGGVAAVGADCGGRLMYVAAKGGERAIENAHRLLAHERRGDPSVPELSVEQIEGQLTLAVDRVMNEGSLYDRELAALAIKQARGDLIEAV